MTEEKLYERIKQAAAAGCLSHAYILEGDSDETLHTLSQRIASMLTPYPEDITWVRLEGKSLKDEAIEKMQERLSLKPMVGELNIAIIESADSMTLRAQNRLLKTLEEPLGGAVILLLVANRLLLLPTILSRCVSLRLDSFENSKPPLEGTPHWQAAKLGELLISEKPFYSYLPYLEDIIKERELAIEVLLSLESWYRDVILEKSGALVSGIWKTDQRLAFWAQQCDVNKAQRMVSLIEEACNDIKKNISPGYTIKNMILKINA